MVSFANLDRFRQVSVRSSSTFSTYYFSLARRIIRRRVRT